ncbi:cytochrome c biogenesis heme-transporting ATPase CcmA [Piscinibacter koreensis]|uniref:Cytochrome c biogenesis heme-transporting ATPase CcmA n=1 Tax=Piscinibacter koreensis TaxID=2742824 RepID=A0A7Y6TXF9_9BURK|nr:cytochrome c biogenesis heme-transporting ATPase CcmA [Schlegelella koreensis]NUZ07128.1 cytochrome c biogenesis heme-transporting ATPase CcmA [Schlegelella koreensis]
MASVVPYPAPASAAPLLQVRGLACRRGERLLFAGLDLDLGAGEIVWLRGPNGSGKTSLLRILAGLATAAEGSRRWAGDALQRPLYLAHANALKDDLGAAESLAFLLRLAGQPADAATCATALGRVGLARQRDAAVRTLSQGQRRRVALARLAVEPSAPVWLLDEPFDALDAAGIGTLDELLAGHAARGGAAIVTSHVPLTLAAPEPITLDLASVAPRGRPAPAAAAAAVACEA